MNRFTCLGISTSIYHLFHEFIYLPCGMTLRYLVLWTNWYTLEHNMCNML